MGPFRSFFILLFFKKGGSDDENYALSHPNKNKYPCYHVYDNKDIKNIKNIKNYTTLKHCHQMTNNFIGLSTI